MHKQCTWKNISFGIVHSKTKSPASPVRAGAPGDIVLNLKKIKIYLISIFIMGILWWSINITEK